MSYWTSFAKSGNPNIEGLQFWDKYTSSHPIVMNLDTKLSLTEARDLALCRLLAEGAVPDP